VFLLGNWKNYDELEEQLSIDELLATLNAQRKRWQEEQKFFAMIQGIDISEPEITDITKLTGARAAEAGFGVGLGLGHSSVEVVSN
jgi:hypothetical protein